MVAFNNSQEALLEFPEKECLLVKIKVIWVISDEMRTTNQCNIASLLPFTRTCLLSAMKTTCFSNGNEMLLRMASKSKTSHIFLKSIFHIKSSIFCWKQAFLVSEAKDCLRN